jgi:tight adherence protein B
VAGIIAALFFVTTFLAAAVAVLIAAFVQSRLRSVREAKEGQRFGEQQEGPSALFQTEAHSSIGVFGLVLDKLNLNVRLRKRLDDAGLKWSVGRAAGLMLLLGTIGAALAMNAEWLPPGSSLVAFGIGCLLPNLYIGSVRDRRISQYESQFPDALESMARAMRAGHPLQGAIEILAADFPSPLGLEFRRIRDERKLGMPWKATLEGFAVRVPITETRLFVAAAMLNSKSGGRFTEVLENLAETVRESAALRGEVRAISAHGKLTGTVLTVLPFGIATLMQMSSPDYLKVLTNHPMGSLMIGAGVGFVVAGHFVIQKIVKIEI